MANDKKIFEIQIKGLDQASQQSQKTVTTMNELKKVLKDLKKEAGNMDINSAEFATASKEIANITSKLKELEKQQGTTSRNVGNYASDIAKAFKDLNKEAKSATEQVKKLNDVPFKLDIDGVAYEFENLSQAIGEVDDKAQALSAQMFALKEAGQGSSEEYAKLSAEFTKYVQVAGKLEKARKYSDEIKDSLSVQNQTLEKSVQAFTALGNAMQIASGIAGLFGQNQEDIEKAINRTVQIMAILQATQELYNATITKGTAVNKLWTASLAAAETVMKSLGIASKGLKIALASTGIGLLVVGITELISLGMKWIDSMKSENELLQEQFDRIQALNNSLSSLYDNQKNINSAKVGLGILTDEEALKNNINTLKKYQTEFLNKFSKNYNIKDSNLLLLTNTSTLNNLNDLANALNKTTSYYESYKKELDALTSSNKELNAEEEKKKRLLESIILVYESQSKYLQEQISNQEELKKLQKEVEEVDNQIIQNRLDALDDGLEKEKALLYERQRQEINAARERSIKVGEVEKSIREKYQAQLLKLEENYRKKREEALNNISSSLSSNNSTINIGRNQLAISINQRDLDERLNQLGEFYKSYKNIAISSAEDITDYFNKYEFNLTKLLIGDSGDDSKIRELETEYANTIEEIIKNGGNKADITNYMKENPILTKLLEQYGDSGAGIVGKIFEAQNKILDQEFENNKKSIIEKYRQLFDDLDKLFKDGLINEKEYKQSSNLLTTQKLNELKLNYDKYLEDIIKLDEEAYKKRGELSKIFYQSLYDSQIYLFNETKKLENQEITPTNTSNGSINLLGDFIKNSQADKKIKEYYENIAKTIEATRKKLIQDFNNGNIDESAFNQSLDNLDNLEEQTNIALENLELNWREKAAAITNIVAEFTNVISDLIGQGLNVAFDNQQREIDNQLSNIDDEINELQNLYDKQAELYENYKNHILDIEEELKDARGGRRQFLIDQISQEIAAEQAAYAQQEKIAKQQETLQMKKQQLEKQSEEIERKRNIANKAVQISQATANTALAVTSALATQPFIPLGVTLAAIAGAMGAAQIGIIAAQKYADGGIIQGRSHAEGGVPVLGGQAELEGGEYVINKTTTSNNAELLDFINSNKSTITLSDMTDFFSGQMSNPSSNMQSISNAIVRDNRPIVVSVVEIEKVSNDVRNVRALAGL